MVEKEEDNPTPARRQIGHGHRGEAEAQTLRTLTLGEWKDILVRVFHAFGDNNVGVVAAGVSFFMLLALFPAIGAFVAIYGLFLDPQTVVQQLGQLQGVIPRDVLDTVTRQMQQVAAGADTKLTVAAAFSLFVALWGTRMGTNALMTALNVVYGENEERGLIKRTLFSLLLSLAIILGLMSMALLVAGIPLAFALLGLDGWPLLVARALGIALAATVLVFGLAALYHWVPDRRAPRWRWVSVGAVVVMVLWLIGSLLFSVYLGISDKYSATYGTLGTVIILLTWIYITVLIMLIGGALNAEVEHQIARDTTVGAPRPVGERGAVVADDVVEPRPDNDAS